MPSAAADCRFHFNLLVVKDVTKRTKPHNLKNLVANIKATADYSRNFFSKRYLKKSDRSCNCSVADFYGSSTHLVVRAKPVKCVTKVNEISSKTLIYTYLFKFLQLLSFSTPQSWWNQFLCLSVVLRLCEKKPHYTDERQVREQLVPLWYDRVTGNQNYDLPHSKQTFYQLSDKIVNYVKCICNYMRLESECELAATPPSFDFPLRQRKTTYITSGNVKEKKATGLSYSPRNSTTIPCDNIYVKMKLQNLEFL